MASRKGTRKESQPALGGKSAQKHAQSAPDPAEKAKSPTKAPQVAAPKSGNSFPIVGVGASAGGFEAFEQFLSALPPNLGMGFVLVQHLAPKHESRLSELLAKTSRIPVVEIRDGMRVEPNHAYVIPPNADLAIQDGILHLSKPLEEIRRLTIDRFFLSLAEDQQSRAIGVVLSGTASDGTLGVQAIKGQGGITFAQDDESAKYKAMPRSAIAAGYVDFVLPPDLIVRELVRIARHMEKFKAGEGAGPEETPLDAETNQIIAVLKKASRVDFSFYKPGTIQRRIARRMFLRKAESVGSYLQFLKDTPAEVDALFHDVLINVTGFFRDPETFEALKSAAFPELIQRKAAPSQLRVWVPGCSTGEEAYSIAICLLEYLEENASNMDIQIFATDISEDIIQTARGGIYPESISVDVTPERLRRYFQNLNGHFQISKSIRDMCVFAKQDITRDPPFSKLDLISCRNVMIYMGQVLQRRIIPLFHYALNPGGVLLLGSSETVGPHSEMFASLDKKHRIYAKRAVAAPLHFEFVPQFHAGEESSPSAAAATQRGPIVPDLQRVADQTLLNRYAPPCVVVNDSLDIVQFIGQTGPFLEPSPGDASLNLLKMVKSGLHHELRAAFPKLKRGGTIRRERLLIQHDGGFKNVNIEVIPVKSPASKSPYYIVVFEEPKQSPAKTKVESRKKEQSRTRSNSDLDVQRLMEELDTTREYLQSIIEEHRTTNEELRSANEEIQSSNEELQSINEELETAKEELQSTNEELTTVNEEMQNRNNELTQLNNDLNNLFVSVNIPIIMLGNDLRIRRFTPQAETVMNLIAADLGRPITDIKPNLKIEDLKAVITNVIDTLKILEADVEDLNGKWYSMRIRPYRTVENKIDGVVIVLLEIPSPRIPH